MAPSKNQLLIFRWHPLLGIYNAHLWHLGLGCDRKIKANGDGVGNSIVTTSQQNDDSSMCSSLAGQRTQTPKTPS